MNISTARINKVTLEILIESLRRGVVPTDDHIKGQLASRLGDLEVTQPVSSQPIPVIEFGEVSSASKFNKIFSNIINDLDAVYDLYTILEKLLVTNSDRTQIKIRRIEKKAQELIDRVNRLLLITNRTEGTIDYVGDNFIDRTKIDASRTDAIVDLTGQVVYGGYLTQGRVLTAATDLSAVQGRDIKITPLDYRLSALPGTFDSRKRDIITSSDRPWLYKVAADEPVSASIEVQIDLSKAIEAAAEPLTATKIVLDPAISNNSFLVLAQYSEDGIIWNDLPVANPSRRIAAPTAYLVEQLNLTHLRFILTSDIHGPVTNTDKYPYVFGIRQLVIHGTLAKYAEESTFTSGRLTLLDENGNRKQFTSIALSTVCEDVPADTELEYQIAFLTPIEGIVNDPDPDNLDEGTFQRIAPLSREDGNQPTVLTVSSLSTATSNQTIDTAPPSYAESINKVNRLLNTDVTTVSRIWRDVGTNNRYRLTRQNDLNATEEGWRFDGTHYHTYIYISEPGGRIFNFGPTKITINSERTTGRVRLNKGIHHIKTAEENWLSMKGLSGIATFNEASKRFTGEQRKYADTGLGDNLVVVPNYSVIDHLYPYNHKLLIEGLDYSPGYIQSVTQLRYTGASKYAAILMDKVAPTDFELNTEDDNYTRFSVVTTRDNLDAVANRAIVKWLEYEDESPREQFDVETTSADYAEGVVLKAILRTQNQYRTPVLEGYEIKLVK